MLLKIIIFTAGFIIVIWTITQTLRTFILPRSQDTLIPRLVFLSVYTLFSLPLRFARTYRQQDRIQAMLAPVVVFLQPLIILILIWVGYGLMFWSLAGSSLRGGLVISGSSLMTLGSVFPGSLLLIVLSFSEAAFGMIFIAMLIGYLPTIYDAFAEQEQQVAILNDRAGSPPSALEYIRRAHSDGWLYDEENFDSDFVGVWHGWFVRLEMDHTTLAGLTFFRSPNPADSWVNTAGIVLDTASLFLAAIDVTHVAGARRVLRRGYGALRKIVNHHHLADYGHDPAPGDTISVSQDQFNALLEELDAAGLPLREDREQAWKDWKAWRVNYDAPLRWLAEVTRAPYAEWVSDRLDIHQAATG